MKKNGLIFGVALLFFVLTTQPNLRKQPLVQKPSSIKKIGTVACFFFRIAICSPPCVLASKHVKLPNEKHAVLPSACIDGSLSRLVRCQRGRVERGLSTVPEEEDE